MDTGARISLDRVYRYHLWRTWDDDAPRFVVIGLNPSTADETVDDPTIRRCIGFARREGCGGLDMVNLFAFRATDPASMKAASDPIGDANDAVIAAVITTRASDRIVAAWGVHGAFLGRGAAVARTCPTLRCFGVTKDGHPKHPLYLSSSTPLVPFPRIA